MSEETKLNQLFDRARSGDERSIYELFEVLYPELLRTVRKVKAKPTSTGSLLNYVFLKLLRSKPTIGSKEQFKGLVYITASNIATDLYRRKSKFIGPENIDAMAGASHANQERDAELKLALRNLRPAIGDEAFHLWVLKVREGYTLEEVTEATAYSLSTVKRILKGVEAHLQERRSSTHLLIKRREV